MELKDNGSVTFNKDEINELRDMLINGSLAILTQVLTDKTMPEKVQKAATEVVGRITKLLKMLRLNSNTASGPVL